VSSSERYAPSEPGPSAGVLPQGHQPAAGVRVHEQWVAGGTSVRR
jgi:hypothetical protein